MLPGGQYQLPGREGQNFRSCQTFVLLPGYPSSIILLIFLKNLKCKDKGNYFEFLISLFNLARWPLPSAFTSQFSWKYRRICSSVRMRTASMTAIRPPAHLTISSGESCRYCL